MRQLAWSRKTAFLIPLFWIIGAYCAEGVADIQDRDHVIQDSFGSWNVRHYFDQETLEHRFSDAKTDLTLENGETIEFQINRRGSDDRVTIIIPGWYEKVEVQADGEKFEWGPSKMHTFWGGANQSVLRAIAQAQSPITVYLHYGQPEGIGEIMRSRGIEPEGIRSGKVRHEGSAAALRWIRAWPRPE